MEQLVQMELLVHQVLTDLVELQGYPAQAELLELTEPQVLMVQVVPLV